MGCIPLLHAEHRHPRKLRYYSNDCSHRRHCGTRADLLHLHHGEPQRVWRPEGYRCYQSTDRLDDPFAGNGGRQYRLRPRHGHGRGLLCHVFKLSADARNHSALASHGEHRGGRALCSRAGKLDEHPPGSRARTSGRFPELSGMVTSDGIAVFSRDVTKVFGRGDTQVPALRGINLKIRLGELTMLVGPSGSGKTTLLCVITGLLDATSGELVVLGQRPAELSQEELILFRRKNLGFVFQQYNLIPALTASENVGVPLLAGGVKRQQAVTRGREFLATLGMAHRANALPSELSGGEQQRVALARALVHEPTLIVCDEPTSALDGRTGHTVMELLSATAVRSDRAVIIVTHDTRIFDFAHQIAHMDDGRIVSLEEDRKNVALTRALAPASTVVSLATKRRAFPYDRRLGT